MDEAAFKYKNVKHLDVKECFQYDPVTGHLTWEKITTPNQISVGDRAGSLDVRDGYRRVRFLGNLYLEHVLIWFYVKGRWPSGIIDHIDRVRHHNWFSNLRSVSNMCNSRNCGNFSHNTSGVKGVTWHIRDLCWDSNITLNKKMYFLGRYNAFDEAVCARLAGEQCLNWFGCDSCSPAYKYVKENIQNVIHGS